MPFSQTSYVIKQKNKINETWLPAPGKPNPGGGMPKGGAIGGPGGRMPGGGMKPGGPPGKPGIGGRWGGNAPPGANPPGGPVGGAGPPLPSAFWKFVYVVLSIL